MRVLHNIYFSFRRKRSNTHLLLWMEQVLSLFFEEQQKPTTAR